MNYFPTRLAVGDAFCNRKEQIKRLIADIKSPNPALLMSARRYGKTSLAIHVFENLNLPYVHIDFYKELTEEDIEKAILNGIGVLIGKIEKGGKKLLKIASDFFSSMQINIVFEKAGFKLDFGKRKVKPADAIFSALEKLHALAKERNKLIILFLDEFQILGEVTENYALEAAIREAAQKSTHVAYIFSGSNRHLLQQMFYDKKRPLYKLCDIIPLERISKDEYVKHIQKGAVLRWGKELDSSVLDCIFNITECHPYYINKLCSLLWLNDIPNEKTVIDCWMQYAIENKSAVERELELLSVNQRRILCNLAKEGSFKEIFGKDMISNVGMSSSSISRAMKFLLEKDYVFIDSSERYKILDPLIKTILTLQIENTY